MATTVAAGNIRLEQILSLTLTPNNGSAITANSSVENTYTLPGVQVNDFIEINKPTHTSGLCVGNVRVSAANQIAIMWCNVTTGSITPIAEAYLVAISRCEYQTIPSVMSA
jgi:hypothetical protein